MEETRFFDEMGTAGGPTRASYVEFAAWLEGQSPRELRRKQRQADTIFRRLGITFAVYGAPPPSIADHAGLAQRPDLVGGVADFGQQLVGCGAPRRISAGVASNRAA